MALKIDQSRLSRLLVLALPAIAEQFLMTMVSYVDTAMVGAMGAAATAAIAVVSSSLWLIGGFMTAMGVGFTYLVAHSVGAGDRETCVSSVQQAVLEMHYLQGMPFFRAAMALHYEERQIYRLHRAGLKAIAAQLLLEGALPGPAGATEGENGK